MNPTPPEAGVLDPPAGTPPTSVGRALRRLDAGLAGSALVAAAAAALGAGTGPLSVLAAGAWIAVELAPAGRWLRAVRRLEWRRARALVATGRARARHASGEPGALGRAGDAYEDEGRARAALRGLGADPSRALGWLRPAVEWLLGARAPGSSSRGEPAS